MKREPTSVTVGGMVHKQRERERGGGAYVEGDDDGGGDVDAFGVDGTETRHSTEVVRQLEIRRPSATLVAPTARLVEPTLRDTPLQNTYCKPL